MLIVTDEHRMRAGVCSLDELCSDHLRNGRHSPEAVLRGMLERTIPEEVLSRALYATQFT